MFASLSSILFPTCLLISVRSCRYILGARVSDASGEAYISAFNNEAESIIGCSADELDKLKAQVYKYGN